MKSYAVIGCGRFGTTLARTLMELGNEVMAVDSNADIVQEMSEDVTYAVQADVMDESTLKELGLSNFDVVVVSIGSDIQASIMASLIAKELGVKKLIAKAQSILHGKVLEKIGVDKVIYPERDMARRLAHNLSSRNILDYIELSSEYNIMEITSLNSWWGKTISELDLRSKYGINIVALKRGVKIDVSPNPDEEILEGDILLIIGNTNDLIKIENKAGE